MPDTGGKPVEVAAKLGLPEEEIRRARVSKVARSRIW
jgi:hypothetical protein